MKTQNKEIRTGKIVLKVILGFAVGITLGYGITKIFKSSNRLSSSIEKTIQENCDCESVAKNISSRGIQFSREDGISNQTASFVLKNCKYDISAKEEAKRINTHLKATVENYEAMDLIELSFNSEERNEIVKIKNGTVL